MAFRGFDVTPNELYVLLGGLHAKRGKQILLTIKQTVFDESSLYRVVTLELIDKELDVTDYRVMGMDLDILLSVLWNSLQPHVSYRERVEVNRYVKKRLTLGLPALLQFEFGLLTIDSRA